MKCAAGFSISAELFLLWDAGESLLAERQEFKDTEVHTFKSAEDKTVMFPMRKKFLSDCSDIIRHCVAVCGQEGEIQADSVLSDDK